MRLLLCLATLTFAASCGTTTPRCSPTSCPTGCCDAAGLCQRGDSSSACGARGADCVSCGVVATCLANVCVLNTSGTGGGSSAGGASGGGSSAGGTSGGGSSAGGASGGGSSAGGTSGGGSSAGGASGGGSSAGGASGGGSSAGGASGGGAAGGGVGGGGTGTCGPGNCAGCCLNGACFALNQQGPVACGLQGAACTSCGIGTCNSGICSATPDAGSCGPSNCSGCCVANTCLAISQQTRFACGLTGAQCQMCSGGSMCNQGTCSGSIDAGATLPNGSACTAASPCAGTCIDEILFGQATGYIGGYCTETCGATPCSNGVCVTEMQFGQSFSQCRAICQAPGTQSTCRPSYVCAPIAGSATGYCRPNCSNGGILASCQAGTTCMPNGVCL